MTTTDSSRPLAGDGYWRSTSRLMLDDRRGRDLARREHDRRSDDARRAGQERS